MQWFDLGVVFASGGGETFPAAEIQRLLLSGQNHTRLKNGKMAVLDTGAVEELQEVLLDCAPQQHARGLSHSQHASRLSRSHVAAARGLAGRRRRRRGANARPGKAARPSWNARRSAAWKRCCGPTKSKAWPGCDFLRANGFGGILADEMGLGKTLQILAFHDCRRRRSRPEMPQSTRPRSRRRI